MEDRALALVAVAGVLALSSCAKSSAVGPAEALNRPTPLARTSTQTGDGYIAEGQSISPFDNGNPAIAHLEPDLRSAMQNAANNARSVGIALRVNSGWRSRQYQQQLLTRAIHTYGSEAVARHYVSTPEQSAHVRGEAVDIGPTDADSWLSQHGSEYGLCQTYGNEMWHFELSTAPGGTCPEMAPDASGG